MPYAIKQFVSALLAPLVLATLVALVGGILWFAGRRRAARWCVVSAAAIAYLGALGPVSDALLAPLERQFAPLTDARPMPPVRFVVVLGSGYDPRPDIPVTSALDEDGLARAVEGIRLWRRLESAKLILSGGAPAGLDAPATGYAELARSLGMTQESLLVLSASLDTADEAREIAGVVGEMPFILVTSAYHLPRAMRLMKREGINPIAAPAGRRVSPPSHFLLSRWLLPSATALRRTERGLHEYVGMLALSLGVE